MYHYHIAYLILIDDILRTSRGNLVQVLARMLENNTIKNLTIFDLVICIGYI